MKRGKLRKEPENSGFVPSGMGGVYIGTLYAKSSVIRAFGRGVFVEFGFYAARCSENSEFVPRFARRIPVLCRLECHFGEKYRLYCPSKRGPGPGPARGVSGAPARGADARLSGPGAPPGDPAAAGPADGLRGPRRRSS